MTTPKHRRKKGTQSGAYASGAVYLRAQNKKKLTYTGCPRRNVKYFGRVFLMLNSTDITQNTYIQS